MKRLACGILLMLALAACAPPRGGPAAPPATAPAPTPTTPPAVVRPQNGSTVWTTAAAGLPTSPRSADWAARIARYADLYDGQPSIEFGLDAASNDYSVPIYDAADATTRVRVFQRPVWNWNGGFDIARGATIPWNPSWLPADGNDGHVLILDSRTGEELDLWAVSTPSFSAAVPQPTRMRPGPQQRPRWLQPGQPTCARRG